MRRAVREREFEEFVTAAWPRLRRAAYLLTHHTQDAEDLLQSVLARTYVRWARVRKDEAYAYVHRALVNAYIDSTRRRGLVLGDHEPAPGPPDTTVEDRSQLTELLAPLTPRERTIIVLRYYLDTPEKQVAATLGVSTGTVKSTASRALSQLRSSVTSESEGQS